MFRFMLISVVSGEVKNEVICSGEVKADWELEFRFRDLASRTLGLAFVLDKSANTRPVPRVVVAGFLGEVAFSVPATFLFFSGVSTGGGFRGPTGFFCLSEGVRTMEFSLRVLGFGTRDSFSVAFSLPEVERTLTVFEVVTGERAVREGTVALLFATCAGVVEPLIGSRGTNTGVLTTGLLAPESVDESGMSWTTEG